jgi:hypothetical protein
MMMIKTTTTHRHEEQQQTTTYKMMSKKVIYLFLTHVARDEDIDLFSPKKKNHTRNSRVEHEERRKIFF